MIHANFTAELHCSHGQIGVADTDEFNNPTFQEDQDGWLCAHDSRPPRFGFKPVLFAFQFIKQEVERSYYYIYAANNWDYRGARLEQNKNGWLGLYGTHVAGRIIDAFNPVNLLRIQDAWKIQTLQPWDGDPATAEGIEFHLRDRNGHRVSEVGEQRYYRGYQHTFLFLHAGDREGEILKFTLRNVTLA